MVAVKQSDEFRVWLDNLTDKIGRSRILARIARIQSSGNFGDCAPVGDGVHELRIDFGPGYRVYFYHEGKSVVFIVRGGDKSSQRRDIKSAKAQQALDRAAPKNSEPPKSATKKMTRTQ